MNPITPKLVINTFFVTLVTLSASCANLSSLQTARVIEKGKNEVVLGAGVAKTDVTIGSTTTALSAPYLQGMYRTGIADSMDLGVKLTLIGTLSADVKYQLVDAGEFALAAGAGLGFVSLTVGSNKLTIIDLVVPVIASYNFSDSFAFYLSPKALLRSASGTATLFAGTGGFKIGESWGLYAEYTIVTSNLYKGNQFDAALFFK
jgi:hypothetical protein